MHPGGWPPSSATSKLEGGPDGRGQGVLDLLPGECRDRRQSQQVPVSAEAEQLSGDQAGPPRGEVRTQRGGQRRGDLAGEDLPASGPRRARWSPPSAAAPAGRRRPGRSPTGRGTAERATAAAHRRDAGQVRQPQVDVQRRIEELRLVAEVAHHHRRVDAGVGGDRADGGAVVAVGREPFPGGPQDRRLGPVGALLRGRCPHRSSVMPTTVGHQPLTFHRDAAPSCQQALANKCWHSRRSEREHRHDHATALPTHTEVAIVGAGPTGLALAVTLASAGIDFVIVDRLAEGANTSRAAVVHARTLEVLDELGAAEALIARGIRVTRFAVRDGSRRLLTVPFDGLPTPLPVHPDGPAVRDREPCCSPGCGHSATTCTGRTRSASVVQDEDGVTLTMSTGQTLRAGLRRRRRRHAQRRPARRRASDSPAAPTASPSSSPTSRWTGRPARDEVSLTFGPAGLTVVAPLPGGHYRIVATVDDAPATPDLAFVQRLLDERAPGQADDHRPGLVLPVPGAPPGRRPLPGRPAAAGRRRRPRAQPRRRSGHEHRHPGRLRPRHGHSPPATSTTTRPSAARSPSGSSPSPTG